MSRFTRLTSRSRNARLIAAAAPFPVFVLIALLRGGRTKEILILGGVYLVFFLADLFLWPRLGGHPPNVSTIQWIRQGRKPRDPN